MLCEPRDGPNVSYRPRTAVNRDNIPLALLGWVAGCPAIWSALFAEGNVLYARLQAVLLTVVFVVSSLVLTFVVRRMWSSE
ncbi:MAG: hypothetical protein ABI875_08205 [Gemmatimonadales bacterium]